MEEARKAAVRNSIAYHEKNKVIYNKKFLPSEVQVGDLVLYEIPRHPNQGKLCALMEGPHKVIRKVSTVNCEIERSVMRRTTEIVHVSKLHQYYCLLWGEVEHVHGHSADDRE